MAKHARKVAEGMAARKKAYTGVGPNQAGKHKAHMPGSQNRKKSGTGHNGRSR